MTSEQSMTQSEAENDIRREQLRVINDIGAENDMLGAKNDTGTQEQ